MICATDTDAKPLICVNSVLQPVVILVTTADTTSLVHGAIEQTPVYITYEIWRRPRSSIPPVAQLLMGPMIEVSLPLIARERKADRFKQEASGLARRLNKVDWQLFVMEGLLTVIVDSRQMLYPNSRGLRIGETRTDDESNDAERKETHGERKGRNWGL